MKKKLTKAKLLKSLEAYSGKELRELIVRLYEKSPESAQVIDSFLLGESYSRELYEEYLKKLNRLISFPGINAGKMKEAENLLKQFASAGAADDLMRLYVDYIELCVDLENDFGMEWEILYKSVYRAFDKLAKLAADADPGTAASLQRRLDLIISRCSDANAFQETMQDIMLNSVFSEEPEE